MLKLLKVFVRGILTTIALPLIVLIWVVYGVYCLGLFVFMFFKNVVDFFQGRDFNGDLKEDLEARRLLLEQEKTHDQAQQMLSSMYESTFNKPVFPQQPPVEEEEDSFFADADIQEEPKKVEQYGPEMFAPEQNEEPRVEENNDDYGDPDDVFGND